MLKRLKRNLHLSYQRVDQHRTLEEKIRVAKKKALRNFVTVINRKNTCGIPYRVLTGKLCTERVFSGLEIPCSPPTIYFAEQAEALVEWLGISASSQYGSHEPGTPPFMAVELKEVLRSITLQKASRLDQLTEELYMQHG
ncbi:hypothetical protein J6590_090441 [Homalodisca vitripennis]|nr:hypothetical protein J6590_090441 [Homalodisca vitripennis]